MPRPHKPRLVCHEPGALYFKPRGIPMIELQEVVLGRDETEALRLADLLGLSQAEVGERMGVSRATVGRILEAAHRKVADALVTGKALRIGDGAAAERPPGAARRAPGRGCGRRRTGQGRTE